MKKFVETGDCQYELTDSEVYIQAKVVHGKWSHLPKSFRSADAKARSRALYCDNNGPLASIAQKF